MSILIDYQELLNRYKEVFWLDIKESPYTNYKQCFIKDIKLFLTEEEFKEFELKKFWIQKECERQDEINYNLSDYEEICYKIAKKKRDEEYRYIITLKERMFILEDYSMDKLHEIANKINNTGTNDYIANSNHCYLFDTTEEK